MKLWIDLFCSGALGSCPELPYPAQPRLIARTADPALVRGIVQGLQLNRYLECDERDILYEEKLADWIITAINNLTAQIREDAIGQFPKGDNEGDFAGCDAKIRLEVIDGK